MTTAQLNFSPKANPGARGEGHPRMSQPSRGRQTLILVISLVGWILFAFWWHRVALQSTPMSAAEAMFALTVMAVATFFFTLAWIRHNMRLARNGKRGTTALYLEPDFRVDSLHRPLVFGDPDEIREGAWLVLDADEREKRYMYRYDERPRSRRTAGGAQHG